MKEIIEKYKKHLIVNEKSHSTIVNYIKHITDLLNKIKVEELSNEIIENYIFNLKDKYSPNTLNICKTAIRGFLKFLGKEKINIPNNAKNIEKLPEFITLEFFEDEIVPQIDYEFPKTYLKVESLLYLMFFTGMRIAEVPLLKRENFDLELREVKIYHKKSKKESKGFYPERVKNLLRNYFRSEPELKNAFNIQVAGIQKIFRRLTPRFPNIHFHPHLFRHSYATNALKEGLSTDDIKYVLGHSSIQSTEIYKHSIGEGERKRHHEKIK